MNTSVQHLIENALNQPVVESHEPVGEHSFFDEDVVKLAHALDFVSGNLDNIGTMEEKVAELYMLQEKLATGEQLSLFGPDPNAITKPTKGGNVTAFNPTVVTDAPANPGSSVRGAVANVSPDDAASVRSGTRQAYLSGAEAGKRKGLAAAGFGDAIKNTWKSGMGGKAALLGGGALTAGLVGKALFGGGQRKTASFVGRWLVPEYDEYDVYLNKTASHDIEVLHDMWEELNYLGDTGAYVTTKVASLKNMDAFEYFLEKVAFGNRAFAGLEDMIDTSQLKSKDEAIQSRNIGYQPIREGDTPTPLQKQERQQALDRMKERDQRRKANSKKGRRAAEMKARGQLPPLVSGGPGQPRVPVSPSEPTRDFARVRASGQRMMDARGSADARLALRQRRNDPKVQAKLKERREAKAARERVIAQQQAEARAQQSQVATSQARTNLERGMSGAQSKTEAVAKRNVSEPLRPRDQVAQAESRVQRAEGRAQAIENRNIQQQANLDANKKRKGQKRVEQRREQLERTQRRAQKQETANRGTKPKKLTPMSEVFPETTPKQPKKLKVDPVPPPRRASSAAGSAASGRGRGLLYGGAALAGLTGLEYLRRKRKERNKRRSA